ncbi:DJ-1 protein-PfpI domain-containing protein [Fusarium keratoplasticum]|uniref:DJ-1 protein-PfpI domain-containing protein n=1 Tax=Fusarium keratoplasticum TaxID=1328300 RepID=A0ACC0QP29_9HYPO|nr:DJ-1 protein-PfpI domain-containing protein [Fusarium keratoplasticum]KAI8660204.1 DJ-1 protein-PfpI domain-containing protein [Fusarium keratoplasticum]KAI8661228.1 DJ-1 protein-PfpI domain-containing protein [Fusarium keratoplasticum]
MAPKVLVVLTSRDKMDNGNPTGWYLPEFAHPYYDLVGEDESNPKAEIVVASPAGGKAPLDEVSIKMFENDPESVKFLNEKKSLWENTRPLSEFLGKASEFDAIFYPGGHGPMFDLVKDETSIKLIEEFYKAGKPVSAVCHGPIVFVNVTIDGKPLLQGREVAGFSNSEEDAVQLTSAMPALLEDEIKRVGGNYVKGEDWGEKLAVDGLVITGQNPASAHAVGKALAKAIGI